MTDTIAQSAETPLARLTAARRPPTLIAQFGALLWKEWREQRLALLALGAFVVLSMVSCRLADLGQYDPVPYFCCLVVAWVLGAGLAGGEHVSGSSDFLMTHPLRLSLVWATKLVFDLVCVAATIGLFAVLSRLHCQLDTTLTPLVWLSLCSFSLSHYYGCWLRSVISAMALAPLALLCIALLLSLNPIVAYLYPSPQMATPLVLLICAVLLALGRGRFVAVARGRVPLTRRQRVGWFLWPVLLLGGAPLLVGFGVFAIDFLRFGPSNIGMVTAVSVAPDGAHALAFARAARHYPPWAANGVRPQPFTVSLNNGVARKLTELSRVTPYGWSLWAPDSRRVAVTVHGDSGRAERETETHRTVILSTEGVCLDQVPGDKYSFPLVWTSPRRLAFVSPNESRRSNRLTVRDVCDRTWTEIALPESLRGSKALYCGHTVDPIQAIMSVRDGTRCQIVLLGLDRSSTRSIAIPSGYAPSGQLRHGMRYMVLPPDTRQGTPRGDSPLLLDLASGDTVSLDRLLGGAPEGGWDEVWTRRVLLDHWLLVMPADPVTEPRLGWYAVDLVRQEAFYHQPPSPSARAGRELYLVSDVLAPMEWYTRRDRRKIVFTDLRNPDISARVVLVIEHGAIGGMARIDDREIVLGFRADPSIDDPKGRHLRVFSHGGLAAIDPAARRARLIWAGKGPDVRWRFMTWREWEDYRR